MLDETDLITCEWMRSNSHHYIFIKDIESCLNHVSGCFGLLWILGSFIQILNRDPNGCGSHWLTLTTMKSKSEIMISEFSFTSISFCAQEMIRKDINTKKIGWNLFEVYGTCFPEMITTVGLFCATSNAFAGAIEIDPFTQNYNRVVVLRETVLDTSYHVAWGLTLSTKLSYSGIANFLGFPSIPYGTNKL